MRKPVTGLLDAVNPAWQYSISSPRRAGYVFFDPRPVDLHDPRPVDLWMAYTAGRELMLVESSVLTSILNAALTEGQHVSGFNFNSRQHMDFYMRGNPARN